MKVLVADDAATSRVLLAATLKKLGHQAVLADNGLSAWEALQREPFPLVIADWLMPEMEGPELCRRIRSTPHAGYTYIVLLTMLTGKANCLEGMASGADDFLSKPFDEDMLTARIRVAERILKLQTYVSQLEGIVPSCPGCKRVREGANQWTHMELYLHKRAATGERRTHCPACLVAASKVPTKVG